MACAVVECVHISTAVSLDRDRVSLDDRLAFAFGVGELTMQIRVECAVCPGTDVDAAVLVENSFKLAFHFRVSQLHTRNPMSLKFVNLPHCPDGCLETTTFISRAGNECKKCTVCKNLVFDNKPRTTATGRDRAVSPRPQQTPYTDPATLKLLTIVEQMAKQLGDVHEALRIQKQ